MEKIKKLEVIEGVYWIEIPEAELYILCACPADAVKHMMQRGVIVARERDGVRFESGPNVVLLSDVMLQNGYFSNLAEFPVLQMLYRQGMILPGHPNNLGVKPLLLGSAKQIQAQLEYIYRGNYGLISREEVEATGVAPEVVEEVMQMKYKFAFGAIRKSEDLLDAQVVTAEAEEIRNGVTVRRTDLNRFEFSYGDEQVTVDLNLKRGANYRSPYPLGFHNITRQYFAVIHSGQGDGWDLNRPSMSSVLMYQGKIYLVDAGANLSYCLMALGIGVNEIEGIFQTHSHD
ncbi:MAG: cyclic nucleotide-binding protein, partial [Gammaproteobacteria bacterium]|nr:cyclic nucleotide-binding protein [Gammaproteobacteria bacterium]